MRIAVAGFQHETNTFVDTVASRADFVRPGGWPPFCTGSEMLDIIATAGTPASGAVVAAREQSVEVVPLLWCIALPSGYVLDDAFEDIAEDICNRFRAALSDGIDGLYLDLHGAMATPSWPDAEGELLKRLRRIAPAPFPIAVSLDLHANLSEEMVHDCTVLDCYRTYPHTDLKDTGAWVMNRLIEILRGRPAPLLAYRAVSYLTSINDQCTFVEPTRGLLAAGRDLEARAGVDRVSQLFGFPLADVPDVGPSIVVQGDNREAVEAAADEMLSKWLDVESQFATHLRSASEAVAEAMELAAAPGAGPVIIADTQDNPGGGGTGDTTGMLRALLEGKAAGAVLVHIADAEAASIAHQAGEGRVIDTAIGAALSEEHGSAVEGPWTVLRLGDGNFTGIGPMYRGNPIALGLVALLERDGVKVIVASKKMQGSEPGLLLHLGLVPEELPILVVKSSVHFRGAYQDIARAILPAIAPGGVQADLSKLPYRYALRRPAGANKPKTQEVNA